MVDEPAQSRRDLFKSRWNKILKTQDDEKEKTVGDRATALDDDVSDFLKGSSRANSNASTRSTRPLNNPRINVADANSWPDASQLHQLSIGHPGIPSPLPVDRSGRARRRKDLTVRFAATAPEIIGHGGDETEIPPLEIGHIRAALQRSLSDRRPEVPPESPERHGTGSPIRPGMRDRAQTELGNTEAYSRLTTAGVFGERPPSRDKRGEDHCEKSLQSGFSSPGHSFNATTGAAPPRQLAPPPPRRAVPPLRSLAHPEFLAGTEETLPSQQLDRIHGRIPKIMRKESSEIIAKEQNRMRLEEGQAFARAYRLSQADPAGQDVRSKSHATEHPSTTQPTATDKHAGRIPTLHPVDSLSHHSVPRDQNLPLLNTSSQDHSRSQARSRSPKTPQSQTQRGGIAPQDYIEFFRAGSKSKLDDSSEKSSLTDTQSTTHDSPLQTYEELPQGSPPKDDWTAADETVPNMHGNNSRSEPSTFEPGGPARQAVPPFATDPNSLREAPDTTKFSTEHGSVPSETTESRTSRTAVASRSRRVDAYTARAFEDFASRVNQMKGVFRLTGQKERPISTIPIDQWSRCAFWWLHQGKREIEAQVTSQQHQGLLTQAHVDVAKAWWVLIEVLEAAAVPDDAPDAEDIASLRYHLQMISSWMDKQQVMPPHASLIQGQDTRIWLAYPQFPPDLEYLLGCTAGTVKAGEVLPLEDTSDYFFYQQIPVVASVNTDDPRSDRIRLPCMVSMLRHRLHYRASIMIASQNGLINVLVGPELGSDKKGPTWYDIAWNAKSCSMSVNLPRGLVLKVNMEQTNYKSLSNLLEYTRTVDKSFHPGPNEALVYSSQLVEAQYNDRSTKHTFPEGNIRRSFVGVFEMVQETNHENFVHTAHQGFRLMLITPSTSRTIGVVSQPFDAQSPMIYEVLDKHHKTGRPAVLLHSSKPAHPWRLQVVFESKTTFVDFLSLLHGTFKSHMEQTKVSLPIRSYTCEELGRTSNNNVSALSRLQWHRAELVAGLQSTTSCPTAVRLILSHSAGSLTDRLSLLPGDLHLRLPMDVSNTSIQLLLPPSPGTSQALSRPQLLPGTLESLLPLTSLLASAPTVRTLTLPSLSNLHAFQSALTGMRVVVDVSPTLFSITRRRMVVSLTKKLEATRCRLQVLQPERGGGGGGGGGDGQRIVAVWFEGFAAADSLVFTVRASDAFEAVKGEKGMRSGGVRLVEAKFSLPKRGGAHRDEHDDEDHEREGQRESAAGAKGLNGVPDEVRGRFLNLEGLEYMEEHDDLVVGFDGADDLDAFTQALPGPVNAPRTFLSKRR